MLKKVQLICLFLVLAFGSANAAPKLSQLMNTEWLRCEADSDCVVYYACDDVAINRLYEEVARKLFMTCDAWTNHNPLAKTKCVNGYCVIAKSKTK